MAKQSLVKGKQASTRPPVEADADGHEAVVKGRGQSKAEAFENAKAEQFESVDPGEYVCELATAQFIENEKGESVRIDFKVNDESSDFHGKKIVTFYKMFDEEGNVSKGTGFFNRDMELIAGEKPKYADIEEFCNELGDRELQVVVQVKKNGAYTNAYIQGLAE